MLFRVGHPARMSLSAHCKYKLFPEPLMQATLAYVLIQYVECFHSNLSTTFNLYPEPMRDINISFKENLSE